MIEAYFHTMTLLQQALAEDYGWPADPALRKVFVTRKDRLGDDEDKQFVLSPGPVDLGEGTALVLPPELQSGARSIGIGVVDADASQADVYGTVPVQVTVSVVLGVNDQGTWFRGKAISHQVATIETGRYPGGGFDKNDLDIPVTTDPDDPDLNKYYVPGGLRDVSLCALRSLRGESFIPAATEDDLYVFWRSFIMELSV